MEPAMNDEQLPSLGGKSFEDMKMTNEHGADYWSARDIQPLLGYDQWRNFDGAVKKAKTSCDQSGNDCDHHFAGASKMIEIGKGGTRKVSDYHLSRFACYLIAQNGDPRKPEIALAQRYFAIQTRRQELSDVHAADMERLELRKQAGEEFKNLSGAARAAGVTNPMFGIFHDAGYKGMYGGLGRDAIKKRKGVPEKENLMDRMDTTELAANQFRMTQAREKLARDGVRTEHRAIQTHEQVGREVRAAIQRIGGTLPEQIPPAEPIKHVEKRLKTARPKLVLDGPDAGDFSGRSIWGMMAVTSPPKTRPRAETMNRREILERLNAEAPALKRKYAVKSLAVFGSMARGDDHEGSDVDLLVEFEGPATFRGFMGLKLDLEELFGRKVDLGTVKSLRPEIRASAEKDLLHVP